MGLGAMEIGLIILAVLLLFGYKKLPDASRSLGRSMRIFKGEMKGMKDDDVRTRAEAESVRAEIVDDPLNFRPSKTTETPYAAPQPHAEPRPQPTGRDEQR
ncbi:Sec-independent protein translocase subunit TatA [soil metagenome]